MRLYHATEHADTIRRAGFRDSDPIPSLGIHGGVWLSDVPTTEATTHPATELIAVDIPDDLATRHLVAGSPGETLGRWREFCIPAKLVNRCGRLVEDFPESS